MSSREVFLEGPSPWGFRMNGGADVGHPLRISRVNPGSKAALKGIREGDLITSINGQTTKCLTNSESHALLRTVKENLRLGLNEDKHVSPKRRSRDYNKQTSTSSDKDQVVNGSPSSSKGNDPKPGEKISPSKSRRQRRTKLKTKLKNFFGLGKSESESVSDQENNDETEEKVTSAPTNHVTPQEIASSNNDIQILSSGESSLTSGEHIKKDETEEIYDNFRPVSPQEKEELPSPKEEVVEKMERYNLSSRTTYVTVTEVAANERRDIWELDETLKKIMDCGSPMRSMENSKKKTVNSEEHLLQNGIKENAYNVSFPDDEEEQVKLDSRKKPAIEEVKIVVHSPDEYTVQESQGTNDEVLRENIQFLPPNDVSQLCSAAVSVHDERKYAVSGEDIYNPLMPVEEEAKLRCFLESLELTSTEQENQVQEAKSPTTTYIPPQQHMHYLPVRRYLESISEENSDLSDGDKPWENSETIKNNNDIEGIPDDWRHSPDGIDTSWRDGKSLEEISDIQVISDSPSDTDVLLDDLVKAKTKQLPQPEQDKKNGQITSSKPPLKYTVTRVDEKHHYANIPPFSPTKTEKIPENDSEKNSSKMVPSVDVVKNVVSSYYNTKYKLLESIRVLKEASESEKTESNGKKESCRVESSKVPNIIEDVEIVYIDTSDSETITSVKSDTGEKNDYVPETSEKIEKIEEINDKVKFFSVSSLPEKANKSSTPNFDSTENKKVAEIEESNEEKQETPSSEEILILEDDKGSENSGTIKRRWSHEANRNEKCLSSYTHSASNQSLLDESANSICSLKELSTNVIISLPCGSIMLKELGILQRELSDTCSDYCLGTSEYSFSSGTNLASLGDLTKSFNDLQDDKRHDHEDSSTSSGFVYIPDPAGKEVSGSEDKKWMGVPVSDNPRLLLCVSPSQFKQIPPDPHLASDLLDLHKKFISRRGYHESMSNRPKSNCSEPDLISIDFNQRKDVHTYTPEILFQAEYLLAMKESERHQKVGENQIANPVFIQEKISTDPDSLKTNENHEKHGSVLKNTTDVKKNGIHTDAVTKINEVTVTTNEEKNSKVSKEINDKFLCDSKKESVEIVGNSRLLELIQHVEGESSSSGQDSTDLPRPIISSQSTTDAKVEESVSPEGTRRAPQAELAKSTMDRNNNRQGSDSENTKEFEKENQRYFDAVKYRISKKGDIAIFDSDSPPHSVKKEVIARPKSLPPSGEIFRQRMYEEYMDKVAERSERRQQRVIKLSNVQGAQGSNSESQQIESEFMEKVKERMLKLGLQIEDEDIAESGKEEEEERLPKHLQELMEIMDDRGVWSPVTTPEAERKKYEFPPSKGTPEQKEEKRGETPPAVWTPPSAGASPTLERKFRSINFQSPPPKRKEYKSSEDKPPELPKNLPIESSFDSKSRLVTSTSENSTLSSQLRLPTAQNPTITLLQKAREGQLPKGAQYLESKSEQSLETSTQSTSDIVYTIKKEYKSDSEENPKRILELSPRKFDGIGPVTPEGTPIALRSEVKEDNHQKWYKRMYESLHKAEQDKDYVTVRYSTKRRGHYPYISAGGYLSEPERLNYDSDVSVSKYATLDRRRIRNKENDFTTSTMPRSRYTSAVKHAVDVYKNQPGRIEDYEPGRSSISEKETKQWWDEVMDIFDEGLNKESRSGKTQAAPGRKSFTYVFKDPGYESDSTLVFRRRDSDTMDGQLMSPTDQKVAYKTIQKGGDVPLQGLRKPAPERPKESPHRYLESEVNIHYRSPVRTEAKAVWPEEELAQRQAEVMRRIYQEQRRTKYLNELQDMYSRRHTDNFIPSQKSPIPLNRYDDFPVESQPPRPRDRTPEPKLVARALYNFVGQTSRELSFRRGDIIFVRRQIDKNWYEGEHNAMIGLFPFNYVEIIPYDGIRTLPKKSTEGQARAKFNFQAQTHLELSLVKGELVLLTRRVDENWFEGRIGNRKGIFPVSYVEVLVEPGEKSVSPTGPVTNKPLVAPASHSVMLNGAKDLGQQHYQPPRPAIYSTASLPSKHKMNEISLVSQALHIDTRSDPVPYRVLYNYKPQNDDELELREGDIVYVMEKCDDGWYVGSLHRNGQFGTFPGNYVERIQ